MHRFRGQRDEGAQLVETAFALPLLVVIAFGVVQFGMALNRSQGMEAVAREAARMVSIEDTPISSAQTRADATAPEYVDLDDLSLTIERVLTYGDGSQVSHTWSWDPVTDTWSGGNASDVPCHDDLRPDPEDPPLASDLVNNVVIVQVELLNPQDYGVTVPLWGSADLSHPALAEFQCEY